MEEYPILSGIQSPEHLKNIPFKDLEPLAREIRSLIIERVSKNGGHLAPNLGVVELTIALHRVFRSPRDKIIWDVGHQCYAHKLLTGRFDRFETLRLKGGISGFPKREESPHDIFNTGHASTSVSAGLGILIGEKLQGRGGKVLCVIGDGALSGGMALEALNAAGHQKEDLVVILNDNEMSINRNVGGLSNHLSRLALTGGYRKFRVAVDFSISHIPFAGKALLRWVYRLKRSVKELVYKENFFSNLGFKYVGPVDGHDLGQMMDVFGRVKSVEGPVLIHLLTTKGKGYSHAEGDPSAWHGVKPFDRVTGTGSGTSSPEEGPSCTSVFGSVIRELAEKDERITAVSAAMTGGTGLLPFQESYPRRFFDVGIAEAHALTFAAGLAASGMKPVAAVYSTFMQRAVDQLIHDIAIPGLPVVVCMDRAGLVPDDGETHQGIFDIVLFRNIPGISFLAPLSEAEIRMALTWAFEAAGPVLIRYPKGEALCVGDAQNEPLEAGRGVFVHQAGDKAEVLILSLGGLLAECRGAAALLEARGIFCDVYHLRFIQPLDEEHLVDVMRSYRQVLFVEEGLVCGGLGEALAALTGQRKLEVHFDYVGVPGAFPGQASREQLIRSCGLDRESLARRIEKVRSDLRFNEVVDMVRQDKWRSRKI